MVLESDGMARRELLGAGFAGTAALHGLRSRPVLRRMRFDRAAYDSYIQRMNAGDLRFLDHYADDVQFVMGIRGKRAVREFYIRQQPFVRERLEVVFFCSDAHGAAAQVISEIRCIADCADTAIFGRALKSGEVQQVKGCLLYVLDEQGLIAKVMGPPPEILQPWHPASG